ncbi:iron export ABC transporter permease subunit FetB [Labrenzia sp. OB1]|uniref:ABC transporter permease n=1 Tax=Labrenzia sp. OB1 TaxID=1561204 RepID=UPI0007B2236A|nr:iron export ABC transporter permease subunit FetB [Labrenzia sp. OB1]KZM47672.1 ABC transporter permease [Labrenzia sp. OB1]
MNGYLALTYWDLAAASVFLILNAIFSIALNLGLARTLIVSALRMTVQLVLVGLILKAIFFAGSLWWTLLAAAVMAAFAAREIRARQKRRLDGFWGVGLGAGAMLLAGSLVTLYALAGLIRPEPVWQPQYALPLFGMILGNTMTGVSLGLDTLHTALAQGKREVEARLLLGGTRWEATRPALRQALRSGFTPIINAMAATGVVSLPGMMTGQILSGVDPREAVKYQLMIMFLLGGATGLGVLGATFASIWRLTDTRHRLRLDRLDKR